MADKSLTLDRTISFSLVLTVIIQSASALLWAGGGGGASAHPRDGGEYETACVRAARPH